MSNYRLIAVDLDGTLLDSNKNISERTRNILEEANSQGVEIVFSTGRYYDMIPDTVKNLPFINYAICINGAEVYDIKNKKVLFSRLIDLDTALEIMGYLDHQEVIYDAYVNNKGYMSVNDYEKVYDDRYIKSAYHRENIEQFRTFVPDLKQFLLEKGKDLQKFQFFSQNRQAIVTSSQYIKDNYPQCTVSSSLYFNTEINGPDVTKGNALKILAEILGIDISETMAFGDGGNDISLLRAAGLGVAMANAFDDVLKIADYITLTNDNDGVADAIEKLVLQRT